MRRNIILSFALLIFLGLVASPANSQVPSGNAFFGYSYYNTNVSPLGRSNMNGWEGSLEGKVAPLLGLVADFDGHYGSQTFNCEREGGSIDCNTVFSANVSEYNVLFGPRLGVPIGRFRPFGEALIGVGHINAGLAGSDTHFAAAFGGGLDYRIIRPLAWRFQLDYVRTSFFSASQSNVRFSTGVVFRF